MPITPLRTLLVLPIALVLAGCAAAFSSRSAAAADSSPVAASPTASPTTAPMPGMAAMPGMDHAQHVMGAPNIAIPAGAIYTEADVRFMQGMIAHHAQAIYMSRMAVSHGAAPRLVRFAQKIDQSQMAEIHQMQDWLVANKQFAPDTSSWRTMTMPGMLTPAELATMDASRGADFERQFLTLMIRHHEGALSMVKDLFASPRAAQDVDISVFANDVEFVQTAEIALMRQMLEEMQGAGR